MVFYRKYRPQRIGDLDNEEVRERLLQSLQTETSHAFLFTGPKGLGKTSAARIVAKAVNCEKGKVEPCNECDHCVSITNGTNMDVIEIDAASNRGIDEMRDLKEKIRLAPLSAKKKVYIIDEVHMLTTEAFNALLKTLEEPPSHAMFILCTTESHKVPATILSRCTHINFHLATSEELVRSFTRIATGEGLVVDKDALVLLATLSEGGFRDGAKILEEVAGLAHREKITASLIEKNYHVSSIMSSVGGLLDALKQKDAKTGLTLVGTVVEQGIDLKYFLQAVLTQVHEQLLDLVGVKEQGTKSKEQKFSIGEIQMLFALLSKAGLEMKTSVLPQLPLEMAIVEYVTTSTVIPNVTVAVEMTKKQDDVTVSTLRKQVGAIKKQEALYGTTKAKISDANSPVLEHITVDLMHVPANGEVTSEWLAALWKSIISEMKQHNHTIAGVLRGCTITHYDTKQLVIQANFPFHKERLEEGKTKEALANVCKLLTGKDVVVRVELKK